MDDKPCMNTSPTISHQIVMMKRKLEKLRVKQLKRENLNKKGSRSKQAAVFGATANLKVLTWPKEVFRGQPLSARPSSSKTDATSVESRGTGESSVPPSERVAVHTSRLCQPSSRKQFKIISMTKHPAASTKNV